MGAFYQIKMEDDWSANRGPMIRQDWLDDLGLEVPETYDELHDVLTAFKTEKGATKAIFMTMYGVLCGSSVATGYDVAVGTNGVDPFLFQIDGTVLCGFQQQGFKDYLTMMHQWYEEGLISKDFVGADETFGWGDNIHNAVANGESGYWIAEYRNSATSWADENVDSNCVISAIPEAVQTSGQTIHLNSNAGRIDYPGLSITTACEQPELAAAYLNFFYTDTGIILKNYGEEGVTYTVDGDASDWHNYKLTDVILADPDGNSAEKMSYTYCFAQVPTLLDNKRFLPTDIEDDRKTWSTNKDGAYDLPKDSVLSITVDESTTYSNAFGEVLTYTQEATARFITGELSLDSDWQTFQDTIVQLGVQDCIDVYQAALDRYNQR
jgi:putative aldouronate transport system substrate-binding protein